MAFARHAAQGIRTSGAGSSAKNLRELLKLIADGHKIV
jgi:hypothetical protein